MGYYEKCEAKCGDYLYVLFRALVGILFFMHGWMKFGNGMPQGLMLAAGVIEIVTGIAVVFGLFTRLLATISAVEMAVAFFMSHAPNGLNPLANGGEPAVLFFAAFLVLIVYGSRKWSLEQAIFKKEAF